MPRPVDTQQVDDAQTESAFLAEGQGYEAHLKLWEEMRTLIDTYPRWQILKELCEQEARHCFEIWMGLNNLHRPEVQERAIMLRERSRTLRWLWTEAEQLASDTNRETWLGRLKDLRERFTQWLNSKGK